MLAASCNSLEQAMRNVADDQSPNALAADSDKVEEFALFIHS